MLHPSFPRSIRIRLISQSALHHTTLHCNFAPENTSKLPFSLSSILGPFDFSHSTSIPLHNVNSLMSDSTPSQIFTFWFVSINGTQSDPQCPGHLADRRPSSSLHTVPEFPNPESCKTFPSFLHVPWLHPTCSKASWSQPPI